MDLTTPRATSLLHDLPLETLKARPSGIALWRPEIVLPQGLVTPPVRGWVVIAEPSQRPEAVRVQIDATRDALASLAEAREALGAKANESGERAIRAGSERERVAAMIETYRMKTALEDVLQGTLQQVSALMGERGRR